MSYYERIMKLRIKRASLNSEIEKLNPKAVKELRKQGLSFQTIASALMMGKKTVVKIANKRRKKK